VFEDLGTHRRIAVTGPQRSGTTIAARMIAHDTGFTFVDETQFGVHDPAGLRAALDADGVVVQCPSMLRHLVDEPVPGVLVVLMRRRLDEIHASEDRINWESALRGNSKELAVFGLTEGDSARLKYEYWDSHDRPFPNREVDYDSLPAHPLFVPAGLRSEFAPKQTTVR
jgi:hypothetical protein